jgi:hypothetical protein
MTIDSRVRRGRITIFFSRIRAQPGPREPLYEVFCVRKTDLWSRDGAGRRTRRRIFEGNLTRVFGRGIFDRVSVAGIWKDLLISVSISLDRLVGQIPQYNGQCSRNSAAGGVIC